MYTNTCSNYLAEGSVSPSGTNQEKKTINLTQTVVKYRALVTRLTKQLQTEDAQLVASYLGLCISNYYAKRSGTKPFQYKDIGRLVARFGTKEDQTILSEFLKARNGLYAWMEKSPIPLAYFRQLLGLQHHKNLARRGTHPDSWKLEDMERIGALIDHLSSFTIE